MALHVTTGSGAPTGVPVSVGEHYIDVDTGDHYISNGTDAADNWAKMIVMTDYVRLSSAGRLQVKNEGPGAAEFESLELRKELVLAPGVTRTLVFHPMKPGTYKFFDEFHQDTAQGRIVAK